MLLVVDVGILIIFFIGETGHIYWVITAERDRLVFQILLQKFSPKLLVLIRALVVNRNLMVVGLFQVRILYQQSFTVIS
jgi:hypothetical protein